MARRRMTTWLLALGALLSSQVARAQDDVVPMRRGGTEGEAGYSAKAPLPPPRQFALESAPLSNARAFYGRGRQHVAGYLGAYYFYDPTDDVGPAETGYSVNVGPVWTYFIRDRIGLGLSGNFHYDNIGDPSRYVYVGFHAMFGFPFAERVSWLLWPEFQAGYDVEAGERRFSTSLYAPVMFHPSARIALGIGPEVGLGRGVYGQVRSVIAISLGGESRGGTPR